MDFNQDNLDIDGTLEFPKGLHDMVTITLIDHVISEKNDDEYINIHFEGVNKSKNKCEYVHRMKTSGKEGSQLQFLFKTIGHCLKDVVDRDAMFKVFSSTPDGDWAGLAKNLEVLRAKSKNPNVKIKISQTVYQGKVRIGFNAIEMPYVEPAKGTRLVWNPAKDDQQPTPTASNGPSNNNDGPGYATPSSEGAMGTMEL